MQYPNTIKPTDKETCNDFRNIAIKCVFFWPKCISVILSLNVVQT